MDLISPLIPAFILGTAAQFLRGKWKIWWTPLVTFILLMGLIILSLHPTNPCENPPPDVIVEVCTPPSFPWKAAVLTSVYFSILALIFHLVAKGLDVYLNRWIENPWFRSLVVTYITLVLLQLWVEVFPWTVVLPYRFS